MTTPKLRFPEFLGAGEWEVKILGNVATFTKGKGISKSELSLNGSQPCIRYGELYTHYKETIESVVSYTNILPKDLIFSKKNDVIIPASGETQIDIATASCVLKDGIALGSDLNIIRSKMNGVFLSYYLNNAKKKAISELAQGISVIHLYANQLKTLVINIPTLPEQQKIADCLSTLDDRIEAENQKLAQLKTHKKALMQQLFPAEGETVPRLRFAEFLGAGEWVVKKLGDICSILNNQRKPITSTDREHGSYPYYGASGIVDYVNNYIFSESLVLVGEDGAKWGAYEKTAFIATGKYWVNNHAHVIKSIEIIDVLLVNYLIMLDLSPFVTGAAPPKLTLGKIKEIPIPTPTLPEQQKIADCLSSLDELINLQTQKIATLKTHKKGMMQQLFPQNTNEGTV